MESFSGNAVTNTTGTESTQYVVYGVQTRTTVSQAYVRNHKSWLFELGCFQRVLVRAGNGDHPVAKPLENALEVQRDQRLVLDDEHIGGDLPADFGPCFLEQLLDPSFGYLQGLGRLFWAEPLHGDQQEGLPSLGRKRCQGARGGIADQAGLRPESPY